MSISASLTNALSGLNVSGRKAEIVSQNIANSQTDGYGRRELSTSSSWGGVTSDGVLRHIDRGLLNDRRQAESQLGADQRTATMLEDLESVIGIPGEEDSISGRLAEFESALILAANDPSSDQRLLAANTSLIDVTAGFRRASVAIQSLRQNADRMIDQDVFLLNSGLKQVEQLNADILRTRAAGQDTSSLMDSRQQIVDGISGIVPLRELERGAEQLGLMTTSGLILLDGKAAEFTFTKTPTITADMTLDSGGLSGIEMNGQPLDLKSGFGRLTGGTLHAAFQQRDADLVDAQGKLDALAYDLADRFANTNTDPTYTSLGLLTDSGAPLDPLDLVGISGRLSVNENVDPTQNGDLSRWRDGVGAISAGPIGNGTQLERWRVALNSDTPVASRLAEFASETSGNRLRAQTAQSFSAARWDSLHLAELAMGVDTDVELQNLLVIEQAYAANAKVIQAVDSMMNKILEI